MLVIFEGADGAGKSTLIKRITSLFNWKTMVAERYDKNTFEDYYNAAISNDIVLCDRSPISDIVYRLCDDAPVGPFNLFDLMCILAKNVKIVYCKTDDMFESAMERGEKFITNKKHHQNICANYDTIITLLEKFTSVPILTYDWKTCDTSNVIKFIKKEEYYETV